MKIKLLLVFLLGSFVGGRALLAVDAPTATELIIGNYNSGVYSSAVIGSGNTFASSYLGIATGFYNEIYNSTGYIIAGEYNLVSVNSTAVFGSFHTVAANNYGLVAGSGNWVEDMNAIVLGIGLISAPAVISAPMDFDNPKIILGKNNDETVENPLFIIGNGTYTERSNALEITQDGRIRIPKRQGDVGMGQFGNGGSDL